MVKTRRQQIESAASVLFREHGYPGTSVRDIARTVELQGASLYAHVASKEDLLWSIVERAADRFDAALDVVSEREPTSSERGAASATEMLRAMTRAHVGVITENLGNATSFLDEWRFLSDGRRHAILERRRSYEARFREAIARGRALGEFRDVDEGLAARWMLSALNGIATWYRPGGRRSPAEIADTYADLFLGALTAHATPDHQRTTNGRTLR